MAYNELALLVDVNGRPIPQYYDVVNDEFKPLGTMPMQDAAVKEELELLKAELETIKANQTSGDQKVQLSGKKARLDTIVDAYSLAAGSAKYWDMGMTDESDVYAIISCDKGPWRLTVNAPWGGSYLTDGLYPRRESEAATTVGYAKVSRIIIPGSIPANATEAANLAIGAWPTSGNIRIANNHDTDTATVTIKMLRVWR